MPPLLLVLALAGCAPTPPATDDTQVSPSETPSGPLTGGTWSLTPATSAVLAHHGWIDARLDTAAELVAVCTADAVEDEVIWAASEGPVTDTRLELYGLLADTVYRCGVTADGETLGEVTLTTGAEAPTPVYEVTRSGDPWGVWTAATSARSTAPLVR